MNNIFKINTDFSEYTKIFLNENSKVNLISKNDEKLLYEKHIYDSLSIKLFFDKYDYTPKTLLDIGTGGGFPSVPIGIEYPKIQVFAVDSIRKKISAVENIKNELKLNNLTLLNQRVETISNLKFDCITSRAVSKISNIIDYAKPLLKNNGYVILYKSKLAEEELEDAKNILRKNNMILKDIIEYSLPTTEKFERKLIVIQKVKSNE